MSNYYEDVSFKAEQTRDRLREAETGRLLLRTGIDQRGWLRIQADKVSCRLGEVLVAVGGRLICHESERQAAFEPIAA
jgi:hypothetical protein